MSFLRLLALALLLTGCDSTWNAVGPQPTPPGPVDLFDSPQADSSAHSLDGDALVDVVTLSSPFAVHAVVVRATIDEGALIEVRTEGDWAPIVFAEELGRYRTGLLQLDGAYDLAFRSTDPADFFHVELFEDEEPTYDDHVGSVPAGQEPEEDHGLREGPAMDAVAGRWVPSTEAWIAGQEQDVSYEGFDGCSGSEEAGSRMLGDYLVENFGASHVGIYNCRLIGSGPYWSIHGTGRAIDVMVPTDGGQADNGAGDPIAHFLMENAEYIGLQFIIWDRSDWMAARGGDKMEPYWGGHAHHDHLHIELTDAGARMESGFFVDGLPGPGLSGPRGGNVVDMAASRSGDGYWTARADGRVHAHGDAVHYGDAAEIDLVGSIQGIVSTPSGLGYWLVAMDGGVFSFGDAGFFGSMGGEYMNAPVVDMAPTASGEGYWLVGMDGGVFSFGDAEFHGSAADLSLVRPVVGMAADPGGEGYWLAAADGGVFTFGDVDFPGSMAGEGYEVIDIAADPSGPGVWLTAQTGEVFGLGGAPSHGGAQDLGLVAPVSGIAPLPSGDGYWQVALDGGVFSWGDAQPYGADN